MHTYHTDGVTLTIKPHKRHARFPEHYTIEVDEIGDWYLVPQALIGERIVLGMFGGYKVISKDKYEIVLKTDTPRKIKPRKYKSIKPPIMNNILFFDTETTGKPLSYAAPMTDLGNWPRVIQLAWAMFSPDGKLISKHCDLIRPDGWEIPTEKFWIDNGYSTAKNMAQGKPMAGVLEDFAAAAVVCNEMVAHNMGFDYKVLGAEMIRYQIRVGRKLERSCTMEDGTDVCKLPGFKGMYKWPTLAELHTKLFGVGFDGAHDAMADVEACARCYFRMRELAGKK